MQFALPDNLALQIAAYDPDLKKKMRAERRDAAAQAPKKPTYPLGLIDDLFPEDVMPQQEQLELAKRINTLSAPNRVLTGESEKYQWLVVHDKGLWMALHNKVGESSYTIKVAHKATPACCRQIKTLTVGGLYLTNSPDMETKKYGRTNFYTKSIYVDESVYTRCAYSNPWERVFRSWSKSQVVKSRVCDQYAKQLFKTLPRWSDTHLLGRVQTRNPIDLLFPSEASNKDMPDGKLTGRTVLIRAINFARIDDKFREVWINSPYFNREAARVAQEVNDLFYDRECNTKRKTTAPFELFKHRMRQVGYFARIWPDQPIDHLQRMFELSEWLGYGYQSPNAAALQWLRANMPAESFIQIAQRAVSIAQIEWSASAAARSGDSYNEWGAPNRTMNEWIDMVSMMERIASAQSKGELQMDPPPRWRLSTFHEHVNALAFKVTTPNEILPQDLFPEPVRCQFMDQSWSFFQPVDIHQLASWGRAVRNCVGNASSYREGVKKKTHFIVLCLIDGKPRYTLMAKVSQGSLVIDQISDIGNKRLTDTERAAFQHTFSMALILRAATTEHAPITPAPAGDTP